MNDTLTKNLRCLPYHQMMELAQYVVQSLQARGACTIGITPELIAELLSSVPSSSSDAEMMGQMLDQIITIQALQGGK